MKFLKQLIKRKIINNEICSGIVEQSAITVVISDMNMLKHCVAAELHYCNQLNRTKFGLDVIFTSFLNYVISFCSRKDCFLMFLVS